MVYFVITGRQVGKYICRCFDSIISQKNPNWRCIYIDDASTDDTFLHAMDYAGRNYEKIFVYQNVTRSYKQHSFEEALKHIPSDAIVAELDADDCLVSNDVVDIILTLHIAYDLVWTNHKTTNQSLREWDTWKSTFVDRSFNRKYVQSDYAVWDTRNFPGHMRTFKKVLYKYINRIDHRFQHKKLIAAYDMVYYTSLLEITNPEMWCFLDKELYEYFILDHNDEFKEIDLKKENIDTSNKEHCQTHVDKWFKDQEVYKRLAFSSTVRIIENSYAVRELLLDNKKIAAFQLPYNKDKFYLLLSQSKVHVNFDI